MNSARTIAGLHAAMASLTATSSQIARAPRPAALNLATADPAAAMAQGLIQQRWVIYRFEANLKVIQAGTEMVGSVLDTQA